MRKFISIVLSLLFLIASCQAPQAHRKIATQVDLNHLNQLVRKVKSLSPEREAEVKVMRSNLLKYMIQASYKPDSEKLRILEEANRYFQYAGSQIYHNLLMELENAAPDKFVTLLKPPRWTLNEEIKFLNRKVNEFAAYYNIEQMQGAARTFFSLYQSAGGQFPYMDKDQSLVVNSMLQAFLEQDLSESNKLQLMNRVEEEISPYVARIRNIGNELVDDSFLKFNDKEFDYVIKKFIADYYKQIDIDVVKSILSTLVEVNPNAPPKEMAAILFQYAGPGLGKTLQQLGKEPAVAAEIQKILATLESDGLSVPPHMVYEIIAKDNAYEFISVEDTPLGTGTMAQVHAAKVRINGEEKQVVVRFLKPGVEEASMKDIAFVKQFITDIQNDPNVNLAKIPDIDKIIKSTEGFLYKELDIQGTIQRQIQAQKVYQRSIKVNVTDGTQALVEFKVPAVYPPPKGKKSNLHVQEFVTHGKKFTDLEKAGDQEAVARAMLDLWFSEALFRSGYIHADLHQGNFTVLLAENNSKIEVAIFDYGISAELPSQTREAFMLIAAGAQMQDSELLARGLLSVEQSTVDKQARRELSKLINAEMKNHKWEPEQWIIWAVKNGYLTNEELGSLARGGTLILQLPVTIGKFDLAKKDLMQVSKREFLAWISGKREDFPLKLNNLARISWSATRFGCHEVLSKIFKRK
ncbi:MAG: hypothetical protein Fur0010_06670 [Bdellovibrio sp.]